MDHFASDAFSSRVLELMQQHHVPGVSIAVVQGDECVAKGYGYAHLDTSEPCTEDTLFDVASSSKSLTAAAVGFLVADNDKYPEVQYDATMSSLLPEDFVMSGVGYTEGVTVDDVLSHRTGMAGHDLSYMSPRAAQPDDARSVTRNLRNLEAAAPLRSRYIYCNMMYTVATHLIEIKSQQEFATFLYERFFEPLGMSSTSLQPARAREQGHANRLATGYHWNKGNYLPIPIPDCPEAQGAGSIITSARDFIKWIKALIRLEHPVSEKVYQGLVRLRSFPNPSMRRLKPFTSPTFYAAGLDIYYYRGHMIVGHDGCISGFGSRFFFLPESKFGAIIMGNSSGTGALANAVVRELIDAVLCVPKDEQATKKQPNKPKKGVGADGKPAMPHHSKDEPAGASAEKTKHEKQEDRPKKESSQAEKAPKAPSQPSKNKAPKGKGKAQPPPQETPLDAYLGTYSHPGYHEMSVEVKDEKLFIDATNRSFGFTLTFEHVSDQQMYTAHLSDMWEGGDDPVKAEFIFENGRAVKMGLALEDAIKEPIWFELQDAPDRT